MTTLAILIIEDEPQLGEFISTHLRNAGHNPVLATCLAQAHRAVAEHHFDVAVIDRLLPDGDGLDFIDALRERGADVPVLVLSALTSIDERVEGLGRGGDDYLTKPFDMAELNARVAALTRRARMASPTTELSVGDLRIDLLAQRVKREGKTIRLQPKEFKLLEFLARHSEQVVTRAMLLKEVWGLSFDPQTNVVDVHVSRLRNKLDAEFDRPLLHTVRGAGYRLGLHE